MFEVRISAATVADLKANIESLAAQYGVAAPEAAAPAPAPEAAAPAPAPEAKPKRKPRKKPELTYEKDVKPLLIKLASQSDEGKAAAKEMIVSRGFKKGDEVPAEEYPSMIAELTNALAAAEDDDDDGAF